MELTEAQINELIQTLIATNTIGDVTALDVRTVLTQMNAYTKQTDSKLQAIADMANAAMNKADANETKNEAQDTRLDAIDGATGAIQRIDSTVEALENTVTMIQEEGTPTSGLTPEQVAANALERGTNKARGEANALDIVEIKTDIVDLKADKVTQDADIDQLQIDVATAQAGADTANGGLSSALVRIRDNEIAIANIPDVGTGLTDLQEENINKLPTAFQDITNNADETARVKVIAVRGEEKVDTLRGEFDALNPEVTTATDFIEEAGDIPAQNPGLQYSGAFGNPPAFGSIVLPLAAQLGDLPAERTVHLSGGALFPSFRSTSSGFEPLFSYVIEQGGRRLVGRGNPATEAAEPTRQVIERDWVPIDVDNEYADLNFDARTGSDPVIRFAMIFTGASGSFTPRTIHFNVDYVGPLKAPVVKIVRDETNPLFAQVRDDLTRIEGKADTNTAGVAENKAEVAGASALATNVNARLNQAPFRFVEEAEVVGTDTPVTEGTTLNETLGNGTSDFARHYDADNVANLTRVVTRLTDASQRLLYGTGIVAFVRNNQVIGNEFVAGTDASVDEVERDLTTSDGHGTRGNPLNIPFGVNGLPADERRSFSVGYPRADQETDDMSFAFSTLINGRTLALSQTIQIQPRSGATRDLAVPGVTNIILRLTDRQTYVDAAILNTNGNDALASNSASINIYAGWVETVRTPQTQDRQQEVVLGSFDGHNVLGMDLEIAGDSDTETVKLVTPTQTIDTGYTIGTDKRAEIGTENPTFAFFAVDNDVTFTPLALAQLDGSDLQLGLFTRTNHHEDSLRFAGQISAVSAGGERVLDMAGAILGLQGDGESGVRGLTDASFLRGGVYNGAIVEAARQELPLMGDDETASLIPEQIALLTDSGSARSVLLPYPDIAVGRELYTLDAEIEFAGTAPSGRYEIGYGATSSTSVLTEIIHSGNAVVSFGDNRIVPLMLEVDIARPLFIRLYKGSLNANIRASFNRFTVITQNDANGALVAGVSRIVNHVNTPILETIGTIESTLAEQGETSEANKTGLATEVERVDTIISENTARDTAIGAAQALAETADGKADTNTEGVAGAVARLDGLPDAIKATAGDNPVSVAVTDAVETALALDDAGMETVLSVPTNTPSGGIENYTRPLPYPEGLPRNRSSYMLNVRFIPSRAAQLILRYTDNGEALRTFGASSSSAFVYNGAVDIRRAIELRVNTQSSIDSTSVLLETFEVTASAGSRGVLVDDVENIIARTDLRKDTDENTQGLADVNTRFDGIRLGAVEADVMDNMSIALSEEQTYTATAFGAEQYPLDVVVPPEATQNAMLTGNIGIATTGSAITTISYSILYTDRAGMVIEKTADLPVQFDSAKGIYFVSIPETEVQPRPFQIRIDPTGETAGDSLTFSFLGAATVGTKGVLVDGVITLIDRFGKGEQVDTNTAGIRTNAENLEALTTQVNELPNSGTGGGSASPATLHNYDFVPDLLVYERTFMGAPDPQPANFENGVQFGDQLDVGELIRVYGVPSSAITAQGLTLVPEVIISRIGDAPLPEGFEPTIEYNDEMNSASTIYGGNTISGYDTSTGNTKFQPVTLRASEAPFFSISGFDKDVDDYQVEMRFNVFIDSEFYKSYVVPLEQSVRRIPDLITTVANLPTIATDEQVRNALGTVATAAPFSYNVKFAQDNSGQVARAFRDRSTIPVDFELDENQGASNDTNITIKMFADDETLPNNITANNPFMTRWEGTMNIANNGNGALFARITQRIIHFAGTPSEFSNDRNAVVRLTNVDNQSIPMSYFDSTVSLSQATIDRFPTDETQPLQLELKIEFSTTADFAVLLTRDSPIVKQSLVTEFNGIGISFLQHNASAVVGFDGASPEQVAQIEENTADILELQSSSGGAGGRPTGASGSGMVEHVFEQEFGVGNYATNPAFTLPDNASVIGVGIVVTEAPFSTGGSSVKLYIAGGTRGGFSSNNVAVNQKSVLGAVDVARITDSSPTIGFGDFSSRRITSGKARLTVVYEILELADA